MIVDWHSHIWEPAHLGGEWGAELDKNYPHSVSAGGTPEEHWRAMRAAKIDFSVVIALTSRHFGLDIPNEYVAGYVEKHPDHLAGVASVDPADPNACARLMYAFCDLNMVGVKLAPPYQDFHPHSEAAYAVYRVAAEHDRFVIFHQGAVTHRRGVLDHAQPILLDKVARDFPTMRIIIAHMGQPWINEVIPLLRKHPNVYADLSARCSRPAQLYNILDSALDYGVDAKLLFGSDFPTFDPGEHLRDLLSISDRNSGSRVSRTVIEKIVYQRPPALLGVGRG